MPENLPNAHMRLFGGAQYHRAMAEFRNGIGQLTCPDISREEIVNACGIDDFHDGVNYTRTACVIAVSKARDVFEPFLHQVRGLCNHAPTCLLYHLCICTLRLHSVFAVQLTLIQILSCMYLAHQELEKVCYCYHHRTLPSPHWWLTAAACVTVQHLCFPVLPHLHQLRQIK